MNGKSIYLKYVNKKRLLKTLIELLKIKSPSKNEKQIVDYVEKKIREFGLEVYKDSCGKKFGSNAGNIIAVYKSIESQPSKYKSVFLGAHMDTVKLNGDVNPIIVDGKIVNKNNKCILGGDDKIAIAAIMEALHIIKEKKIPTGDIYILFTISEEIGVLGAKHLDLEKVKADYGFVFDAEGDIGIIYNNAPYHNSINAEFIGKAAHAGIEPEKGISSIKAASSAINNIKLGRIDNETTCNIGKINGGDGRNIVPESTKIEAEARSLELSKLKKITDLIISGFKKGAEKYNARLEYEIIREYDGFEISVDEVPMVIAKKAIERLGIKPEIKSSGGGSDINIFNSKGKIAVNLSAGMEKVHTNKEYVEINQVEKLVALILEICSYRF